jgi:hypothetical protein
MPKSRLLILCLLLPCWVCSVNNAYAKVQFIISYAGGVEHAPYTQLIRSIYEDLGFEVKLIDTPAKRGLILLNNGSVDADVVRLKRVVETYPNLILVEPAIAKGYIVLICAKSVKCDGTVLKNKKSKILTHQDLQGLFQSGEIYAQMIINERLPNAFDMLLRKRWEYALYVLDDYTLNKQSSKFNFLKIKVVSGFHVIHKSKVHLLPLIQQKLEERLPEFHANFEK